MRIVGFCIRLAAHLGVMAAGATLMALGAISAYNSYHALQLFEQHAQTIAGAQSRIPDMPGAEVDAMAAWAPYIMIGGELILGLILIFFGVRGLLLRVAEGLPPPAEAAGTPQGRIGHAIAFGAGTLLGAMLLISSLFSNADHLIPKLLGESANASVIATRTTKDRERYHNLLSYQFETFDGSVIRNEAEVPPGFLRRQEAGSEIEVRYMADNPALHMLPGTVSYTEFTVMSGIYIFLVVAGIAGINRNLNYAIPA